MRLRIELLAALALLAALSGHAQKANQPSQYAGWPSYGGGNEQIRYSSLKQINRSNVSQLKLAWRYDTGDAFEGSEMQCNPIVRHGVLYATTPRLRVIALDAATGKLLWSFDPNPPGEKPRHIRNRGLMYWESGEDRRVYVSSRHWFYAIDARTGRLVPSFGSQGKIDLRQGLGRDPESLTLTVTTPGVVYKDLLIVGSLTGEDLPSPPGDIRAYDARTGELRWTFRTIPRPGDFGYETWPRDAWKYAGGANSWAGMALDEDRGLVFVPTGSAAFDFYGANRAGDNLFANCLIALDAATGRRIWHFQFVKHDVWDRDLPSPPSLVRVKRNGRMVDAVAQVTKSGHIFVFHRETGEPLFPIREINVPRDGIDGEVLAATQPVPVLPPPLARQQITEADLTRRTPEAYKAVLERFRTYRSGAPFLPPSREGTVIAPGFDGGGEWGGTTFDPETGWFYVNSNEMPSIIRLVPREEMKARTSGRRLYVRHCASCHKADLSGSGAEFPSLRGIGSRRSIAEIANVVRGGAGRMPGFGHLEQKAIDAIVSYVAQGEDKEVRLENVKLSPHELKYALDGYQWFQDPDGYPAIRPPWGTLAAVNLNTGKIEWQIPFGEYPALVRQGIRDTGSQNYGGGIVTAGGLFFIGATVFDNKFRVYDKKNGKLLWETTLSAAAIATPAMYEVNGRQFVVIGAGGGKFGQPSGGAYYAFALPEPASK